MQIFSLLTNYRCWLSLAKEKFAPKLLKELDKKFTI